MSPTHFAIIGAGWRTNFFLQVVRELPAQFHCSGVLVRSEEKGEALTQRWHVPAFQSLDELLRQPDLSFVVVSVPWSMTPVFLQKLAQRKIPALAETPPAPNLSGLQELYPLVQQGARIQVAEQYHLQPLHAARIALARTGLLGNITQAQVSAAHGYHGISLIRRLLDISFTNVTITAHSFTSPLIGSIDRDLKLDEEKIISSRQVIAYLDFGDKLGVYDFTGDQYFSYIRSQRVLVRGERGEINNMQVRYLKDYRTPIFFDLTRQNTGEYGNLEGFYHKGILGDSQWLYQNPFPHARLSDDEIAIASCLQKMAHYVEGGPDLYNLAEASQDHYLSMLIDQAVQTQQPVHSTFQPWSA